MATSGFFPDPTLQALSNGLRTISPDLILQSLSTDLKNILFSKIGILLSDDPLQLLKIEQQLESAIAKQGIERAVAGRLIERTLRLELPFSRAYNAIMQAKDQKQLEDLLATKSDVDFRVASKQAAYRISYERFCEAFEKSGLRLQLASIPKDQWISSIAIGCDLASEAHALFEAHPNGHYSGIDIDFNALTQAPVHYLALHKTQMPISSTGLYEINANQLLEDPKVGKKKYQLIIIRNPNLIRKGYERDTFVNVFTNIIPKIAAENATIYLSCYFKSELMEAMQLLGLSTDQNIPEDPCFPQTDYFYVCATYKGPVQKAQASPASAVAESKAPAAKTSPLQGSSFLKKSADNQNASDKDKKAALEQVIQWMPR